MSRDWGWDQWRHHSSQFEASAALTHTHRDGVGKHTSIKKTQKLWDWKIKKRKTFKRFWMFRQEWSDSFVSAVHWFTEEGDAWTACTTNRWNIEKKIRSGLSGYFPVSGASDWLNQFSVFKILSFCLRGLVCFRLNSLPVCVFFAQIRPFFPPEESAPCWFYCWGFSSPKTEQRRTDVLCLQKEKLSIKKEEKEANEKKNDPFDFHFLRMKMLWHFIVLASVMFSAMLRKKKGERELKLLPACVKFFWGGRNSACGGGVFCWRRENHKD